MSPDLRRRAQVERRRRDLALDALNWCRNIAWHFRNPRMSWFVLRLRLHYSYGAPMPPRPAHGIRV